MTAGDGYHGEGQGQRSEDRRKPNRPFADATRKPATGSDGPVQEWRLTQIGLRPDTRNQPIAGSEHVQPRKRSARFFVLKLKGAKPWQVNSGPQKGDENEGAKRGQGKGWPE